MMQAAVYDQFGGPIRITTLPIPSNIPDDGVLLQVCATGVCRSDWHGWKGHDDDIRQCGLPFVPGHEVSGIVVQLGSAITKFRVGDRVAVPFILSCGNCDCCQQGQSTVCLDQQQPGFTIYGSFAEYVVLPRADRNLSHIPKNVSFVQAAALGCRFTTAYRAVVQQGRLQPNQILAVFGVGGVGLSCCMIAAALGCQHIIAVDVNPAALDKAREMGATHVVLANSRSSSSSSNPANAQQTRNQALALTAGHGAHVTIDAGGFRTTCENAVHCTRRGGRMVQVGLLGEDCPEIPMNLVVARELEIVGSHGFAADDLPELMGLVSSGMLDPAQLVEREVTLDEGAQALMAMDHGSPLGMTMITKFRAESRL